MTAPDTAADREAMTRALELARLSPEVGRNPRVGCVLLNPDGDIVAEGYHHGAGEPHAEIEALNHAHAQGIDTTGLTAVVTLEPCNHSGLTGPCSVALVDAGVARVVFAAYDPGRESAGGAETLRAAGIDVVEQVMAEESEAMNATWFFAIRNQRPFVTAKWAQSLDGRSAAADQTSQWITGEQSRSRVHSQRATHGVIMVGTNTALVDNPSLTARQPDGTLYAHQPHAVVVGMREVPDTATVRSHPGGFRQVRSHEPAEVLGELFAEGYRSVYLEGGKTLMSAFIAADLVDEFHITVGPLLLGGNQLAVDDIGVQSMSQAKHLKISSVETLGEDVWVVARPTRMREE